MTAELLEQKAMLIAYLGQKIKAEDWHAVADAAMDLREIEAKLEVLAEMPVQGSVTLKTSEILVHTHKWVYLAAYDQYSCECGERRRNALPSELGESDPSVLRRLG